MEFMNVIKNRQSCRAFTDKKVTESELTAILQSANASPVANGMYQDVQLSVIQNEVLLAKLEANTQNAIPAMEHALYGASTVIAIHCKQEENPAIGMANASVIAENMLLTATSLGLGSVYLMAVPMTAQYNAELCKEIKVPEGFVPCAMVAVGTPLHAPEERELTTGRIHTEYIR